MFIPNMVKDVVEQQLLDLKRGCMTLDKYKSKFKELLHFTVDWDMTNEIWKCRMFETVLRDAIKTPVCIDLFS